MNGAVKEDLISSSKKEKQTQEDSEDDDGPLTTLCSQRWILAYLGMLFGIVVCIYRADMSIAIVCMVKTPHTISNYTGMFLNYNVSSMHSQNNVTDVNFTTTTVVTLTLQGDVDDDVCKENTNDAGARRRQGEFDWDKTTQSYILSAYFYGYLLSQIPAGWLAAKYGGKHVIGIGMALNALFTLLIPVLARGHAYAVVMARALIGLFTGITTPAWFALVGVWALPNERSRFLSIVWLGQNVGMVIGYMSSGELCANGFDSGWGSIFYIHGAIGVLFMVAWLYFVSSSPQNHPRITDKERILIEKHINYRKNTKKRTSKIPWPKVVKTPAIWAVLLTHTFDNFMYYLIVTCLPLFLKEVLKFDIQSNGLFSSLPFISILVGLTISGTLADFIMSKGILSRTATRKLLQISGMLGECIFIVLAGYITCDKPEVVIVCLCLCTFFEFVGIGAGYPCNYVDMAPSYSSVLFGISNTIATLPGTAAPLLVAKLTPNGTTEEWRMVFFIAAGLVLSAAIVYGLFSTSELVPWAAETKDRLNHEIVINEPGPGEELKSLNVENGEIKDCKD